MKTNLFLGSLLLSIVTVMITSCSNDEIVENTTELSENPNQTGITAKIIDLGTGDDSFFDEYPEARAETNQGAPQESNENIQAEEDGQPVTQRLVCTRQKVSVQDGSTDFQLFGGLNSDVVFPGNLLQGKTVVDPEVTTPSIIPVKRAGGTISISLNGGVTTPSVTVDEVKTSTIQDAINQIINSSSGAVPANFNLSIEQMESEEQLALEMGLSFKAWKSKVESDFSFSTEKQFNRTLVKLTQTFYTMNFDTPTRPEDIFAGDVTQEEYTPHINQNNPATYISSVAYGRIFYMLIESTSSRQEMQAQLNLSYSGFGTSAEASLDIETFKSLKDLKIKVIAYGGDSDGAITLAGESTVEEIADKLAKSTNIQTALPLSYKVRSVYNPSKVIGVRLGAEFDVVNCEVKGVLPPSGYQELANLFEDGIGAVSQVKGAIILVFNTAGNRYAFYNVAKGKVLGQTFALKDPNGPLHKCPLSNVGAAYLFRFFEVNNSIRLTSLNGLETVSFNFNKSSFNNGMNRPQSNHNIKFGKVEVSSTFFAPGGGLIPDSFEGPYPFPGEQINAIHSANKNPGAFEDHYNFYARDGIIKAKLIKKRKNVQGISFRFPIWEEKTEKVNFSGIKGAGAIGTVDIGGSRESIFFDISGETMLIVKPNDVILGPFVVN
ncbi:thiol-activated cytolysin family protein [Aquimarina algicola]|uniref:Thiol-activated cytolysin n=1 Tax=Aquimarina algicola TaxID=2589995 RepID=A0A504J2J5_9FLAO|nr:thiol-activated cytolysin family protein [Aquimarina algicola]TPN82835.1 hypothetical protein FHK87_20630 [Aquimarina algicola]